MNDSVSARPLPENIGVVIQDLGEVPADIRGPAERAARAAAKKDTRHVPLYFTRPETEEEAGHRRRIVEDGAAKARIEGDAEARGMGPEELVYSVLAADPSATDLGTPPRVDLSGGEACFGLRPRSKAGCAVFVRGDVSRSDPELALAGEGAGMALEEAVASLVAAAYRRAAWHYRGLGKMGRKSKVKSTDIGLDCRIYARDLVRSNKPW
jgi:hypothetical protein